MSTPTTARVEQDFEAAGRTFHLAATLGPGDSSDESVLVYGAHVTDDAGEYVFNGSLVPTTDGPDALVEFATYVRGVRVAVAREAEAAADADTCEHGLSASLCEGPQHYPADDIAF